MKSITMILLVALCLLPTRFAFAQELELFPTPTPSPTSTPTDSPNPVASPSPALNPVLQNHIKKTAMASPIKAVHRPPPPEEYDVSKISFYPPTSKFIPSLKNQIMLNMRCYESSVIDITTTGISFLSASSLSYNRTDGRLVSTNAAEPFTVHPEDAKLADTVIQKFHPLELNIEPLEVRMKVDQLKSSDGYNLVETLRDSLGRDKYDVNVYKSLTTGCYVPPIVPTPH